MKEQKRIQEEVKKAEQASNTLKEEKRLRLKQQAAGLRVCALSSYISELTVSLIISIYTLILVPGFSYQTVILLRLHYHPYKGQSHRPRLRTLPYWMRLLSMVVVLVLFTLPVTKR
jgi:hypothetical protein